MESKIEHLKMIQGIITRMNTNSFQIKGMDDNIGISTISTLC